MERRSYLIIGVVVLLVGAFVLILVGSLRSRRQARWMEEAPVIKPGAALIGKGLKIPTTAVPVVQAEIPEAELEALMEQPEPPSVGPGELQGEYDTNLDGKTDKEVYYRGKTLSKIVLDTNFDGEMDQWWHYTRGRLSLAEDDTNFDGKVDQWEYYGKGKIVTKMKFDTNYDEEPDKWVNFRGGVPAEISLDTDYDGRVDRKEKK